MNLAAKSGIVCSRGRTRPESALRIRKTRDSAEPPAARGLIGGAWQQADLPRGGIEALRERLWGLGEAALGISESLGVNVGRREVAESTRALIGVRRGGITTADGSGQLRECVASRLTPEVKAHYHTGRRLGRVSPISAEARRQGIDSWWAGSIQQRAVLPGDANSTSS